MIRKLIVAAATCALTFCTTAYAQNIEGQVIVSQFAQWQLAGTQALYAGTNTVVPFGTCQASAGKYTFTDLASTQPVKIVDPGNPSLDEVVTPSNVVVGAQSCTATLAPANAHPLPYYITSATGGLQEAINATAQSSTINTAILDKDFFALGGTAAVIHGVTPNANASLVDVTQAPYVNYRDASGTYTANANIGGSAPAAAAGAAAGSSPTIGNVGNGNTFTVNLTTGTSTTTGTLFTETWPASGSFGYAPNATVKSTGTNASPAFACVVTGSSTHVLTCTAEAAPTASTAYVYQITAE